MTHESVLHFPQLTGLYFVVFVSDYASLCTCLGYKQLPHGCPFIIIRLWRPWCKVSVVSLGRWSYYAFIIEARVLWHLVAILSGVYCGECCVDFLFINAASPCFMYASTLFQTVLPEKMSPNIICVTYLKLTKWHFFFFFKAGHLMTHCLSNCHLVTNKIPATLKVLVASFFTLFVWSDTAIRVCPTMWEEGFFFHSPVGQRAVISQAAVNSRSDSHPFSRWWHHRHHEVHPHLAQARGVNESLKLPSYHRKQPLGLVHSTSFTTGYSPVLWDATELSCTRVKLLSI